jgi:hypothetical protein
MDLTGAPEASRVKAMRRPSDPSDREREDHRAAGHVPYRSWCTHCVAAAGRDAAHTRSDADQDQVPTLSTDYGFLQGEDGPPMIVTHCFPDGVVTAAMMESKGATEPAVRFLTGACRPRQRHGTHEERWGTRD